MVLQDNRGEHNEKKLLNTIIHRMVYYQVEAK